MAQSSYNYAAAKERIRKMRDHQECIEISFMDKLQDHCKHLHSIRGCSKALQKQGHPLRECQTMLDILIGKIQSSHGAQGTTFEKFKMKLKHLSLRNNLSTDPDFETGIAHIQGCSEQTMTQTEKRACRPFRKEANSKCSDNSDCGKEDFFLKEFEKAKMQKTMEAISKSDIRIRPRRAREIVSPKSLILREVMLNVSSTTRPLQQGQLGEQAEHEHKMQSLQTEDAPCKGWKMNQPING
jgi:hypothetical protein